jgi:hypothetical protein
MFIFVQNAPIIWFSKRQNTVEAATSGSKFVALQICKELIVALRYKLCMFGVPIEGPANSCQEHEYPRIYVDEETQCNQLSCSTRGHSSWNFTHWKGRW